MLLKLYNKFFDVLLWKQDNDLLISYKDLKDVGRRMRKNESIL